MGKKKSKKTKKSKKQASRKKRTSTKKKSKSGGGSGSGSGASGGSMMTLRGGFKGAVGSLTGKKPKSKKGAIISNIFWTLLTIAVAALLAYRIYKAV
jgi:hypothetical protein